MNIPVRIQTFCDVLGIDAPPTESTMRGAYKEMMKRWHPDRFHNKKDMERIALEKTQRINEAYSCLRKFMEERLQESYEPMRDRRTASRKNTRHHYSWQSYTTGFPDPKIVEIFVDSSHIVSAGYNKTRKILYIKFIGNEIYLYFNVPFFAFKDFVYSRSPGKYAMRFIYKRYRHRKFIPIRYNV